MSCFTFSKLAISLLHYIKAQKNIQLNTSINYLILLLTPKSNFSNVCLHCHFYTNVSTHHFKEKHPKLILNKVRRYNFTHHKVDTSVIIKDSLIFYTLDKFRNVSSTLGQVSLGSHYPYSN